MKLNNMASRREFLSELSTDELDEMLRKELQKENIDDELVRLILDILEDREKDYPVELTEDVMEAAEKFENSIGTHQTQPVKTRCPLVLKVASILLVVGLLLFVVPQAAHAENIFQMLARWTDSVFEFFNPEDGRKKQPEYVFETDHPGLQQIYDKVVAMGVTDPVVPMWVPDGFELYEVKIIEEQSASLLYAIMKCDEMEITIAILVKSTGLPLNHMKDVDDVEIFETAGQDHYIISNNRQINATWIVNNIECSVATDCQEEELYKILDSIYTTEVH